MAGQSQANAREAVYAAIVDVTKSAEQYEGPMKSQMIRDAAHAYRAIAGGPQPGTSVVDTSK
ncbi:hypothetical protein [Phytoactinopolyspora mesophila]|uniref:Uncharacterized protein n=1 Tax=Phytoactinopolyspora mesophila TaxID=2650750 RepID=A0A7K3M3J0_9ACTN|nr:hypothetical protein [Phytoactinopolyspora mesophila]NDL57816.1 hypothetical protein [Phytoactinopolyspora mesophila]